MDKKQMSVSGKDFDISTILIDEIFEKLYDSLLIALKKVHSSQYWPHVVKLQKDACCVKNYKLQNGQVYPCVKLCVHWNELSGNQGNIVDVIISPFGAKYYDLIQSIEFESEELNKAIKKLMISKFPNSSYLQELNKFNQLQVNATANV